MKIDFKGIRVIELPNLIIELSLTLYEPKLIIMFDTSNRTDFMTSKIR
jgi:hypothetical protein